MTEAAPLIRFPAYKEQNLLSIKLGDSSEYRNGKAHEQLIVEDGKYFLISLNSLTIEGVLKNTHLTVNSADWLLRKNDLVMVLSDVAHGNFLGLTDKIPENSKYALNQRMGLIRVNPVVLHSHFVKEYINHKQKYFKLHGQGSSQQNLSKGDILKFTLNVPPLSEQKKIADFLGVVDDKIAGLRERERLLTDYKKGVMQKIFTQALRFKADDGSDFPDWHKLEFGKVVQRAKEKYDPTNEKEDWNSIELESLEQNTGRLLRTFKANNLKSIKSMFKAGDVLFGKLRPNLRKFYYAEFDGVCTSEIWVLRGEQVVGKFLFYLVQLEKFGIACAKTTGSKMPRADWQFVGATPFLFPHPDEQQKIADFLSAVDDKITAVSAQITQMQNFKKGLLQQMFV